MSELDFDTSSNDAGGGIKKPLKENYSGPDSYYLAENLRVVKKTNPYILTSKTAYPVVILFITVGTVAFAGWLYFMYAYFVEKSDVIPVPALIVPLLISMILTVILYVITRSHYTVSIDERTRNIRVVETEKRKTISDLSFSFDQVEKIYTYVRSEQRTVKDQEKTVYYSMCCLILKNGGQIQFTEYEDRSEWSNKQGRLMARIFGKNYSEI